MRRVLFIAYDFPPCGNVGGSIRSERFARYLPEWGWAPTIVASGEPGGKELYPDVHRVRSLTPWERPYQLKPFGWGYPLVRALRRLLRSAGSHEAVYVSCPPFPHSVEVASFCHDEGLPLVIDFRDTWSLDPYMEGSRLKKLLNRHLFPSWERKVLAQAATVLLNSPSALRQYRMRYPALHDKLHLLPNGFDDADFSPGEGSICAASQVCGGPLVLAHVGRFGVGDRRPDVLLDAMALARRAGVTAVLQLIGENSARTRTEVLARNLEECVVLSPPVSHKQALASIESCDIAVLYQEASLAPVTAVAGKTYEYLRAGKPILVVAPLGDNTDLVTRFAAESTIVPQPATAESIAAAIGKLAARKHEGQLPKFTAPNQEYVQAYSRRHLACELAIHFDRLTASDKVAVDGAKAFPLSDR